MAEFAFFETSDEQAKRVAEEMLSEGRTYPIDNKWSVRVDRSHHDPLTIHNHVMLKGRDVAVINRDGSPSHNSEPGAIPNWVRAWLKTQGLTEQNLLLLEPRMLVMGVPSAVVAEAIGFEATIDKSLEHLSKTSGLGSG